MKRKWIFTLICTGIVLSACSQNTNDKTKAGLSEHAKKYESMSYEEYRQETGNEAEFYHGNLFIGEIPESTLCVIYPGEYKEEIAASVLSNDSVPVRLQGRLDELIDGFEKETSFTEFAKSLSPDGGKEAGYELLEGGGTAYYVGNSYLLLQFDSNQDGIHDRQLSICMDDSKGGAIAPESTAWLEIL